MRHLGYLQHLECLEHLRDLEHLEYLEYLRDLEHSGHSEYLEYLRDLEHSGHLERLTYQGHIIRLDSGLQNELPRLQRRRVQIAKRRHKAPFLESLQSQLLLAKHTEALVELVDTATGINNFLSTCVEWVTCTTYVQMQIFTYS